MKKTVIFALSIVFLIVSFGLRDKNKEIEQKSVEKSEKSQKILKIIEIADTDAKRTRGLSGKEGLGEKEGMLFVFDKEGYYGIWMKDMKFPIDIAWLNKDKKIIYLAENVLPETYPKVFNSPVPILYVLEIPAGFLLKYNIKIGDFVAF